MNDGDTRPPDVSVITVVRNDLAGLQATFASVAAQTDVLVEHVVVDGLSSDGCQRWSALHEPADGTSEVFVSEGDAGIYDAMNKGIDLASGDLLIFMNAGDCFAAPDVLAYVVRDWHEHRWSWGYGATDRWDGDVLSWRADNRPFDRAGLVRGSFWVPHQGCFFAATLLNEIGSYDLTIGMAADQELILRAAFAGEPQTWGRTIADFQNGGAHSRITARQRELEWLRIRRKLLDRGTLSLLNDYLRTWVLIGYLTARRAAKAVLNRLAPSVVARRAGRARDAVR